MTTMDCGCNASTATVCLKHALPSNEDDVNLCTRCGEEEAEPMSFLCVHCQPRAEIERLTDAH